MPIYTYTITENIGYTVTEQCVERAQLIQQAMICWNVNIQDQR